MDNDELRHRILLNELAEVKEMIAELTKKIIANETASKMPKPDLPEVGGIELAVKITGFSKATIYKMTSSGQIPYSKPAGGKLLFMSKSLLEWVSSHSKE